MPVAEDIPMPRHQRIARLGGSDRAGLYDEITDRIIAELEEGRLPWIQPWGAAGAAGAQASLALPCNASTGRSYSGINVLILWDAVVQHGYPTQHWLTFRQAQSLGGTVRKGERGTTVVYADRFTPEQEKDRARETGEEAHSIAFLKRFTVFNVAQCDGLPQETLQAAPPPPPDMIEPQAESLIRNTGIDFRIGGRSRLLRARPRLRAGAAAGCLFRADRLAQDGASRAGSCQWPFLAAQPGLFWPLRLPGLCGRGTGGRDVRRLLLRGAWHRADGAPC